MRIQYVRKTLSMREVVTHPILLCASNLKTTSCLQTMVVIHSILLCASNIQIHTYCLEGVVTHSILLCASNTMGSYQKLRTGCYTPYFVMRIQHYLTSYFYAVCCYTPYFVMRIQPIPAIV